MSEVGIGHNGGPDFSILEALQIDASDLADEVDNLGAVENEAQADAVRELIARVKSSGKALDASKDAEKRPHLDANIEIESRYKPIKTAVTKTLAAAQNALTPYSVRLANEREATAKALRDEAKRITDKAASMAVNDVQSDIARESAIKEAEAIKSDARRLEREATGLVTSWEAEITDYLAFGKWAWSNRQAQYLQFLDDLASKEVRTLKADLPGMTAHERKRAR